MHATPRRAVNAIVVGGQGGIGAAVVGLLSAHAEVTSIDRAPRADVVLDVADHREGSPYRQWLTLVATKPPNLIAWCAGVYDRRDPADYSPARVKEVIETNLSSFLLFASALAVGQRQDRRPRRLVVVGSQAAVTGGTDAVYAASKAGLVAAVKSLAREYTRIGLLTNVVSPGPTDSPMAQVMGDRRDHYERTIPSGRFNTVQEVAAVIAWLLLDAPPTVSGSTFDIDGGMVRR
jgi:NAD(P)-dependent dehydrogenase (short-subunit alcohol dehydrogenase family)